VQRDHSLAHRAPESRRTLRFHLILVGDAVRVQSRIESLCRGEAVAGAWQAPLARDPAASGPPA
jgi:class 3 adenylate cyclase